MKHETKSDEEFIQHLMDESGVKSSDSLQRALLDLRGGSAGPVSAPADDLAQLMSPTVVALRPRRRGVKAAGVGLAVAAAAGIGVSGVAAASPQFRTATDNTVQQIVEFFDPSSAVTPVEPPADTGPAPAPGVLPSTAPSGKDASSRDVAFGKLEPGEAGPNQDQDVLEETNPAEKPDNTGLGLGHGIAPRLSPAPAQDRLELPGLRDVAPSLGHAGKGERPARDQGLGSDAGKQQGQEEQQGRDALQPNGPRQNERSETSDSTGLPSPFSDFTPLDGLHPSGK